MLHQIIKLLKRSYQMKANVGGTDKTIRIILGIVLLALVFVGPKTPWGWIGLIPLLTGLFNFCPAWALLKINTRKQA